jgi:hypothetical protein
MHRHKFILQQQIILVLGDIVYEAGPEYTHTSGKRILKIASKVVITWNT